ncbi:LysE family translocator [Marinomonas epiphytica]
MNEIAMLATLATVHFIALISPGPDFALVVQNASRYGRQTGSFVALGLSLGILTHAILSIVGVSLVVQQNPLLFQMLQIAGGLYLLYLGFNALLATYKNWSQQHTLTLPSEMLISHRRQAFSKGFITNILNPKALVFFVSLMSSLIPVTTSWEIKVSALILIWGLSITWFSALAWLLTKPSSQKILGNASRYIDLICGMLFCSIGLGILWKVAFT